MGIGESSHLAFRTELRVPSQDYLDQGSRLTATSRHKHLPRWLMVGACVQQHEQSACAALEIGLQDVAHHQ